MLLAPRLTTLSQTALGHRLIKNMHGFPCYCLTVSELVATAHGYGCSLRHHALKYKTSLAIPFPTFAAVAAARQFRYGLSYSN